MPETVLHASLEPSAIFRFYGPVIRRTISIIKISSEALRIASRPLRAQIYIVFVLN
jgi:hypothetical protein